MKRAIAYVRCSTKTQDNGDSQVLEIKNYCKGRYDFDEFESRREVISGAAENREVLNSLFSITPDETDTIIVSDTSRLSREDEYLSLLNIVQRLLNNGLNIFFLEGEKEYIAGTKLNLVDIITLAAKAQANAEEREKIKGRFKRGKVKKIEQGCFVGHKVAYGFKVIPNPAKTNTNEFGKSLYVVDETKVEVIKMVYDLIGKDCLTIRDAAKHLNKIGEFRDGKDWGVSSIYKLVRNTIYKGDYSNTGATGNVESIVSVDVWNLANQKLKSNQMVKNKGKNFNLLKGIAKCACGCSLVYITRGSDPKEIYYRCVSKNDYKLSGKCPNYGINQIFLDKIVWNVTKAFINATDFKIKTEQKRKTINKEIEVKQRNILKYTYEATEKAKSVSSLTDVITYTQDFNVIPVLTKRLSLLIEEQDKLNSIINTATAELAELHSIQKTFADSMLPSLIQETTPEDKNEIFKKYLKSVTYYTIARSKGIVVITYNNGLESLILVKSHPKLEAYQLPESFSFNPETKKITTSFAEFDNSDGDMFVIPRTATKEQTYEEVKFNYCYTENIMDIAN